MNKTIAEELKALQPEMERVGLLMEYYGGFSGIAEHRKELYGASHIMQSWIEGIEEDAES